MATEKETLQARAEELGLDTEGTKAQLKEVIAAAEAEESGDVVDSSPEVEDAPEELPPAPAAPVKAAPKAARAGSVQEYTVMSAFYLNTAEGLKLASRGSTVTLTEKQATKYTRYGNVKLAS